MPPNSAHMGRSAAGIVALVLAPIPLGQGPGPDINLKDCNPVLYTAGAVIVLPFGNVYFPSVAVLVTGMNFQQPIKLQYSQ